VPVNRRVVARPGVKELTVRPLQNR